MNNVLNAWMPNRTPIRIYVFINKYGPFADCMNELNNNSIWNIADTIYDKRPCLDLTLKMAKVYAKKLNPTMEFQKTFGKLMSYGDVVTALIEYLPEENTSDSEDTQKAETEEDSHQTQPEPAVPDYPVTAQRVQYMLGTAIITLENEKLITSAEAKIVRESLTVYGGLAYIVKDAIGFYGNQAYVADNLLLNYIKDRIRCYIDNYRNQYNIDRCAQKSTPKQMSLKEFSERMEAEESKEPEPVSKKSYNWFKTPYAGVRYREHQTRRDEYGYPDKYYTVRLKIKGKVQEEGIGWSSEGITAEFAHKLVAKFRRNNRLGSGPTSIAELRKANNGTFSIDTKIQRASRLPKHVYETAHKTIADKLIEAGENGLTTAEIHELIATTGARADPWVISKMLNAVSKQVRVGVIGRSGMSWIYAVEQDGYKVYPRILTQSRDPLEQLVGNPKQGYQVWQEKERLAALFNQYGYDPFTAPELADFLGFPKHRSIYPLLVKYVEEGWIAESDANIYLKSYAIQPEIVEKLITLGMLSKPTENGVVQSKTKEVSQPKKDNVTLTSLQDLSKALIQDKDLEVEVVEPAKPAKKAAPKKTPEITRMTSKELIPLLIKDNNFHNKMTILRYLDKAKEGTIKDFTDVLFMDRNAVQPIVLKMCDQEKILERTRSVVEDGQTRYMYAPRKTEQAIRQEEEAPKKSTNIIQFSHIGKTTTKYNIQSRQQAVLNLAKKGFELTPSNVRTSLNVDSGAAAYILRQMCNDGILEKTKIGREVVYYVSEAYKRELELPQDMKVQTQGA